MFDFIPFFRLAALILASAEVSGLEGPPVKPEERIERAEKYIGFIMKKGAP
jgi:hypothetical protein